MKMFYTFHSHMESQAKLFAWSISKEKSAESKQKNKLVWGINHLKKSSVIIGDNSLSPFDPVDSNPFGVLN